MFGWRVASYLSVAVRNTSGALCGFSVHLPPVDGCSTGPALCPCSPRAECVVRCVPLKVVSVGSTSVFCFRKLFSFSAHLQKNEARLDGGPASFGSPAPAGAFDYQASWCHKATHSAAATH